MWKKILFLLALANILVLDVFLFENFKTVSETKNSINSLTLSTKISNSCPTDCLTKIEETTLAVNKTASSVGNTGGTTQSTQRELYIPLGSGTNSSDDWEDVDGLRALVDPATYGRIKSVHFEVSVNVANARQIVYVRLYNETDKHPVWFSEIVFQADNPPTFQESSPITLDPGYKSYKVQMKTQLKYTTNLNSSRIRIVTF